MLRTKEEFDVYDEETIIHKLKSRFWSIKTIESFNSMFKVGDEIEFWDGESGYKGEPFEFEKGIIKELPNNLYPNSILLVQTEWDIKMRCINHVPLFYVKKKRI